MAERRKVFVADPIHEGGMARLGRNFDLVGPDDAAEAEAVIVRLSRIAPDFLARCPKLRAVIKHGIGVDNIDIPACTARGVLVANTPGGSNAHCVAEGAVTLMLSLLRRVVPRHEAIVAGNYMQARNGPPGLSLWGKTVGIVGLGKTGRFAARICSQGFDCKVLAYGPTASDEAFADVGAERVATLAELLRRADAVSIHVPLTAATRNLIGAAELALMKPSAIIVNTARGGIVDETALAEALKAGIIAGAGIDAMTEEPPNAGSPLLAAPNTVFSPHVAGMTLDSLQELGIAVAEATEQALGGVMPATTLNPEAWSGRG